MKFLFRIKLIFIAFFGYFIVKMTYKWLFVRGPEKLNGKRIIAAEDTTHVVTKTKPEKNSGLFFFRLSFLICIGYVFIPQFKYIKFIHSLKEKKRKKASRKKDIFCMLLFENRVQISKKCSELC